MMKSIKWLVFLTSILIFACGCKKTDSTAEYNPVETEITLETEVGTVYGSLKIPNEEGAFPVVLIIAGSGPTDRNGNNTISGSSNNLKMISESLAMNGFASLRYDKRGVAKSYHSDFNEEDLVFDNYVEDAVAWLNQLKGDERFTKIFVLGHSEGALIGSIVANQIEVDGFVSVSGTAQKVDALILEQLSSQPDYILTEAQTILDSLNEEILVSNVSQALYALFRPSVQPYMISWLKYDPIVEMSNISTPVLILHGTTDLQVKSSEAELLGQSNDLAEVIVIEGMNHVLKDASNVVEENLATYSNPNLPLSKGFYAAINDFLE
ncbi:MAG: alpha/beta hydrolase [Chitinophagales bacterium]